MKLENNMRRIIIIALLLNCLAVFGQEKGKIRLGSKDRISLYSSSINDLGFGLTLEVDERTKRVEYTNTIPNQPYNNLVYLEGAKNINLYAFLKNDSASFYRYTIHIEGKLIVTDAIPIVSNGKPSSKTILIDLGRFNLEDKKLTISYYKIDDRLKIGTVIIYNKPFKLAQFKLVAINTRAGKQSYVGNIKWKDSLTFTINNIWNQKYRS